MPVEYDEESGEPTSNPVREVARVLHDALGSNWEIDYNGGYYEAAQAVLDSGWLRHTLADAFDAGIGVGGRYGHDDGWDGDDINPYNDNPYRTKEERELGL